MNVLSARFRSARLSASFRPLLSVLPFRSFRFLFLPVQFSRCDSPSLLLPASTSASLLRSASAFPSAFAPVPLRSLEFFLLSDPSKRYSEEFLSQTPALLSLLPAFLSVLQSFDLPSLGLVSQSLCRSFRLLSVRFLLPALAFRFPLPSST